MATVISFINNKGGVGKTTLACTTAQALAIIGKKVLAIDNDGQHNMTTMLKLAPQNPNAESLYTIGATKTADLEQAIEDMTIQTTIDNLHCITAPDTLSGDDIENEYILADAIRKTYVNDFYDFVIIDNHPGIARLQRASLHAADFVFIPTELQQFAVNGLSVLYRLLKESFDFKPKNIKIIPNKCRAIRKHTDFLEALHKMFPSSVTTPIPFDSTFDDIVTEGKVLFLDRLFSSKSVPHIVKLLTDNFRLREEKMNDDLLAERNKHLADKARERFQQQYNV